MAENTKIEWTDHTFNPWIGCTKVSPACDHCYAEALMDTRHGRAKWGAGEPRSRTAPSTWRKPLQWHRQAQQFFEEHGRRQRVFCASLADVFDNEVPVEWRRDLFDLIEATPDLDWLLLTKRVGNVRRMMFDLGYDDVPMPENVWLGATICNQEEANRDIPKLLDIPVNIRFLSMEPLLGPVDLGIIWLRRDGERGTDLSNRLGDYVRPLHGNFIGSPLIHWVIVGGESGAKARPMNPEWVISLRDQCEAPGTAFLFKQWGEFMPVEIEDSVTHTGIEYRRTGKAKAGRRLHGRTHDGFPL